MGDPMTLRDALVTLHEAARTGDTGHSLSCRVDDCYVLQALHEHLWVTSFGTGAAAEHCAVCGPSVSRYVTSMTTVDGGRDKAAGDIASLARDVVEAWDNCTDPRVNNRLSVKDWDALHDEAIEALRNGLKRAEEARP